MHDTDLIQLAWAWANAKHGGPFEIRSVSSLPESLEQRITAREPFRGQAREDVRLWISVPIFLGIGLDVAVEPVVREPYGDWAETIAGLTIAISWSFDMSGRQREGFTTRLRRLGREDGIWRIIEVWDAPARAAYLNERAQFEAFLRTHGR